MLPPLFAKPPQINGRKGFFRKKSRDYTYIHPWTKLPDY
jgi:hypothetical protein